MTQLAIPKSPSLKGKKYNGFSCPQEGLDERFVQSLAVVHARKCVRGLLEQYSPDLERHSVGLTLLLQNWLLQDSSFEAVWDLSLGNILDGLQTGLAEPAVLMQQVAELGLRLQAFGLEGYWQARLLSPVRLRLGTYWLPLADRLEVEGCKGKVRIRLGLASGVEEYEICHTPDGWMAGKNQPESFIYVKTSTSQISLLPGKVFHLEDPELAMVASPNISPAMKANVLASLQLVQEYSPLYLPWIERVIRVLVPGGTGENKFFSGSVLTRPGLLHLSIDVLPVMIAELLVHEATHQYMYLLRRLGPLDDGSDPTLYYSPVKQTGRPIAAIALAYHAFANIILFYRYCQANNLPDDGYCQRNEKLMMQQVAVLEQALYTSRALTAHGRALWEPLAWRLHER